MFEGRDGLGRRTGEGGGCRVRSGAQGRELAAGPAFPWWPQASLLVVHLQRITLGKGRHKQEINVYHSPDGAVRGPKGVIRAPCVEYDGEWCVRDLCL